MPWRGLPVALLLAVSASGQEQPTRKPDPYTQGDREKLVAAGYGPLQRFSWGDDHGTSDIEATLGGEALRWLETEHFRIGSSLPAYRIPRDKEQQKKLRQELTRLAERLPLVDPKTKKLDPWLRLHLFAQRIEALYGEFEERLGVDDGSFPEAPGQLVDGRYMGEGPYFGLPGRFTVLLLEKESSLGRYNRRFLSSATDSPRRHYFPGQGSLLLVTASECADGSLADDTALHCHVAFNLSQNLLVGYRFYTHNLPLWWQEGLAHWIARRISPRHSNASTRDAENLDMRKAWDWAPKVRARVGHDYYPKAEEMLRWTDIDAMDFADHMMAWSRVDYLMSLGDERFAAFVDGMSGPLVEPGQPLTPQILLEQQEVALNEAWGLDAGEFDAAWAAWVEKTYPKR